LFYLIYIFLFISCATHTTGIVDPKLNQPNPWVFKYTGSKNEANNYLKRLLIINGFTIRNDDINAGFLVSGAKKLANDEKLELSVLTGAFLYALANVSIESQNGYITFIYEAHENYVVVSMICKIKVISSQEKNIFRIDYSESEDITVIQGHPFPIKMKNKILLNPNFTLNNQ